MARRKSVPPTGSPAPLEKREAQRFTLILRAGKLVTAGGEFLCVLRDVSSGGLKVRLFHPLPLDGQCQIELAGGERYDLEPAWQDGDQAGFRFQGGPVEVTRLLDETGPFPKRSIRLHLPQPLPVLLHGEGPAVAARLCDISQHGAAIACESRLPLGRPVELSAPALGAIEARVRWRRGEHYGLVFQQSFRLDDLARLVAQLQLPRRCDSAPTGKVRVNH